MAYGTTGTESWYTWWTGGDDGSTPYTGGVMWHKGGGTDPPRVLADNDPHYKGSYPFCTGTPTVNGSPQPLQSRYCWRHRLAFETWGWDGNPEEEYPHMWFNWDEDPFLREKHDSLLAWYNFFTAINKVRAYEAGYGGTISPTERNLYDGSGYWGFGQPTNPWIGDRNWRNHCAGAMAMWQCATEVSIKTWCKCLGSGDGWNPIDDTWAEFLAGLEDEDAVAYPSTWHPAINTVGFEAGLKCIAPGLEYCIWYGNISRLSVAVRISSDYMPSTPSQFTIGIPVQIGYYADDAHILDIYGDDGSRPASLKIYLATGDGYDDDTDLLASYTFQELIAMTEPFSGENDPRANGLPYPAREVMVNFPLPVDDANYSSGSGSWNYFILKLDTDNTTETGGSMGSPGYTNDPIDDGNYYETIQMRVGTTANQYIKVRAYVDDYGDI